MYSVDCHHYYSDTKEKFKELAVSFDLIVLDCMDAATLAHTHPPTHPHTHTQPVSPQLINSAPEAYSETLPLYVAML